MNDITALSQRMKQQATLANEFLYVETSNVLALVEALEKAQQKVDVYDMLREDYGLCEKGVGLADFVDWQAKRIASLESSTVTVKLPAEYLNADGSVNADMANTCPVVSAYREAHRAAGIQVIEGEG